MVEKKIDPFAGKGQSLSSDVQSLGLDINKNFEFYVDQNSPMTKINIRLNNGEIINQEFNLTNTVADIFTFVMGVAPVDGSFQLVEGFPPKPLEEVNKTIGELKLQGTTLIQRLS